MRLDCIGVVFLALLSHTMNHQLALLHTLLVISWEQILLIVATETQFLKKKSKAKVKKLINYF